MAEDLTVSEHYTHIYAGTAQTLVGLDSNLFELFGLGKRAKLSNNMSPQKRLELGGYELGLAMLIRKTCELVVSINADLHNVTVQLLEANEVAHEDWPTQVEIEAARKDSTQAVEVENGWVSSVQLGETCYEQVQHVGERVHLLTKLLEAELFGSEADTEQHPALVSLAVMDAKVDFLGVAVGDVVAAIARRNNIGRDHFVEPVARVALIAERPTAPPHTL